MNMVPAFFRAIFAEKNKSQKFCGEIDFAKNGTLGITSIQKFWFLENKSFFLTMPPVSLEHPGLVRPLPLEHLPPLPSHLLEQAGAI